MNLPTNARLVRLHDRLYASDARPVWRVNPRTGFLETRAGLSWTGIREYRTATGELVRVLRRFEQVNSPGHRKTLRLLPATDGHPAGDVDVSPANEADLRVGSSGDQIDVEAFDGYLRPVGNVSVSRPSAIAKMVDAETWQDYCQRFPDLARLAQHSGEPPATGTSLGYNALWFEPYVDSEIVRDADGEILYGVWEGPNGPEQYDIEHVVDPDCAVVQELVRTSGFDPDVLGGNHLAVALAELGGRGLEQSELLRIVDSRDVITLDHVRRASEGAVQNNSTSIGGTPTNQVEQSAIDQQPEAIPKASPQVREPKRMKTQSIEIGLGRDAFNTLTKSGLVARLAAKKVTIPQRQGVLLPVSDEIDGKALMAKLEELAAFAGELVEMLAESAGETEAVKKDMEDMAPKEDMVKAIAEKEGEIEALKAQMAEAEKTSDALKTECEAAKAERDSLVAEVEPLRAAALKALREDAVALGIEGDKIKDASAAEIRRAVVVHKIGDSLSGATDEVVAGAYAGLRHALTQQNTQTNTAGASEPSKVVDAFTQVPAVSPGKREATNTNTNESAPSWRDGLAASGG